jgi:hypothetical protein
VADEHVLPLEEKHQKYLSLRKEWDEINEKIAQAEKLELALRANALYQREMNLFDQMKNLEE